MKTCHFFYLILSAVGLFDSVDGTVSEGTCTVEYPEVASHISLSSGYSEQATQVIIPEATFTSHGRITSWTMAVACNSARSDWSTKLQVWARGAQEGAYVLRHSEDVFLNFVCNNHVETFYPKTLYFQPGDILGVYTVPSSQNYIQMGYRRGINSDLKRYYQQKLQSTPLNSVVLSELEELTDRTPLISVQVSCNKNPSILNSQESSTLPSNVITDQPIIPSTTIPQLSFLSTTSLLTSPTTITPLTTPSTATPQRKSPSTTTSPLSSPSTTTPLEPFSIEIVPSESVSSSMDTNIMATTGPDITLSDTLSQVWITAIVGVLLVFTIIATVGILALTTIVCMRMHTQKKIQPALELQHDSVNVEQNPVYEQIENITHRPGTFNYGIQSETRMEEENVTNTGDYAETQWVGFEIDSVQLEMNPIYEPLETILHRLRNNNNCEYQSEARHLGVLEESEDNVSYSPPTDDHTDSEDNMFGTYVLVHS